MTHVLTDAPKRRNTWLGLTHHDVYKLRLYAMLGSSVTALAKHFHIGPPYARAIISGEEFGKGPWPSRPGIWRESFTSYKSDGWKVTPSVEPLEVVRPTDIEAQPPRAGLIKTEDGWREL